MTKQKDEIKDALTSISKKKGNQNKGKTPLIVQQVKAPKQRKYIGRPSQKDPSIEYVKICASVPMDTRKQMKIALFSEFSNLHKTQDDFVNAAILHYIGSKK